MCRSHSIMRKTGTCEARDDLRDMVWDLESAETKIEDEYSPGEPPQP